MSRSVSVAVPFPLLSLLAVALTLAPACSSDPSSAENPPLQPLPEAGADSVTPDAQDQPDAPPADAGPGARLALFTVSDYATASYLAVVDLDQTTPAATTASFADQDSIVVADRQHAFVLHRTAGSVSVLPTDGSAEAVREIDVNPAGDAGKANPYAVLVPAADKAYVVRYGQNQLTVIDPSAGATVASEIDLGEFAADPDGLVDAFGGLFDPSTGRAYIGVQRIDQNAFGEAPDYVAACGTTRAAIVGIDTATDTVVDLNGASDGKLIELDTANPSTMLWDEAAHRILVMGVGCAAGDAGTDREGRGVQSVDPSTAEVAWLWQTTALDRPAALLWVGEHEALVALDDASYMRHWYTWDPSSPSLGAELQDIPQMPTWDGERGLIGLQASASEAGDMLDIVRYDLDAKATSTLVTGAFGTGGWFAYSSATVR